MSESVAESPAELFRRVRRVEVTARRLVAEQFAGSYHSVFKGRGIEFAQVREYVPGDDVRLIDWNATARLGKPFVKLFTEERELTVMLLVDLSASMSFGTADRLKRHLAAEFCAAIAFSAIANNDRVGLVLFTDRVEKIIPAKKGRQHILSLLHELLKWEPVGHGTRVDLALETAGRLMHRAGTLFAVSDFLMPLGRSGEPHPFERALRQASRRHDVIAVTIGDRLEHEPQALPTEGLYRFEDPETGQVALVDLAHRPTRTALLTRRAALDAQRRAMFTRAEVEEIALATHKSLVEPVIGFFRRRARHLRQGV